MKVLIADGHIVGEIGGLRFGSAAEA